MKNYNYTARDATGAQKKGSLQAADRNAALTALKEQGMTPLSVTEGVKELPSETKRLTVIIAASAVIALLVVIAAVALLRTQPKEKAEKRKQPDKPKVAQVSKKPSPVRRNAETNVAPRQPVAPEKAPVITAEPVPAVTNAAVAQTPPIPDGPLPPATEEPATNKPAPVFKTGTEQVISWIANTRLGDAPPPLPNLPLKENIAAILNKDVLLYDDDSKQVEDIKYNVANAKQMLKDYIAKGGDPQEFLAYYHTELKNAHSEWMKSQKQVIELHQAGDAKATLAYIEEQNKALQAKGIKPLIIPPALRK